MEETIAAVLAFFFASRAKFFYYLTMLLIDKMNISYIKLAISAPRPYMIESSILPISCSKAFGSPSGHSSAAALVGILVFLDLFHGKSSPYSRPRYYGYPSYFLCLFLVLYWAISIPFTRFLLGAHSLDQIIFGSTLGLFEALFLHFVVRDHLINHIEQVLSSHNLKS